MHLCILQEPIRINIEIWTLDPPLIYHKHYIITDTKRISSLRLSTVSLMFNFVLYRNYYTPNYFYWNQPKEGDKQQRHPSNCVHSIQLQFIFRPKILTPWFSPCCDFTKFSPFSFIFCDSFTVSFFSRFTSRLHSETKPISIFWSISHHSTHNLHFWRPVHICFWTWNSMNL